MSAYGDLTLYFLNELFSHPAAACSKALKKHDKTAGCVSAWEREICARVLIGFDDPKLTHPALLAAIFPFETSLDTRARFMRNVVNQQPFTHYPRLLEMLEEVEQLFVQLNTRLQQGQGQER